MNLTIYQIDAFTREVFRGNPAAVCPLTAWLSAEVMQRIAAENNLAETAFFVPNGDGYGIRWFTPAAEVPLCGHATLATAHAIFNFVTPEAESIAFSSASGRLKVTRENDLLVLDFPANPPHTAPVPDGLASALGREPVATLAAGHFIVALFDSESDVAALAPDFGALKKLACHEVIATAPGDAVDFVSRMFAPKLGIDEDPVTGAAHCVLTPYWAERLGKTNLQARQISARGGDVRCELAGERVKMAGHAVLYLKGEIYI